MEGNVEFDDDDGDNYVQTRRLNIQVTDTGFGASGSKSSASVAGIHKRKVKRMYGATMRDLHYKICQRLLQEFIPLVLEALYPGEKVFAIRVKAVCKLMWLRYLGAKSVPLVLDIYALIFLSMRKLNHFPVYVDEYLVLLRENKVPYLNVLTLLTDEERRLISSTTVARLCPYSVPQDDLFHRRVRKIALELSDLDKWEMPTDYFSPNAFRLFMELKLNNAPELLVMHHRITRAVHRNKAMTVNQGNLKYSPDIRSVAISFVVLMIYFCGTKKVVDLRKWVPWLQRQNSDIPAFNDLRHVMNLNEILDLSDEQITRYYEWIHRSIVPVHTKDDESLSMMDRQLFRIFHYEAADEEENNDREGRHEQKGPPFAMVNNTFTEGELQALAKELIKYLRVRYGLKEETMVDCSNIIELGLFRRLKYSRANTIQI